MCKGHGLMRPELKPINILPGLFTITSDREAVGRYKTGNKIRFLHGLPQKIGGWAKAGANTFAGMCRALVDWQSLARVKYIGLGTHKKLYVYDTGGVYYDITPIASSGTFANDPLTTTIGTPTVNTLHVAHGRLAGDAVIIGGATAVGGITPDGEYDVVTVVDADNYTITHSSNATSTATGGGAAVTYTYLLAIGSSSTVFGYGWGAGAYGLSTYGTARTISSLLTFLRTWGLSPWGDDLIANPRGGAIYLWDESAGTSTRAAVISGTPTTGYGIFVSEEDKRLVVLGAHNGSTADPMLLRWSDDEDYTVFTASSSVAAGQKRFTIGNELLCRVPVSGGNLIHSDAYCWKMTSIGPPFYYQFDPIGDNGSLMGPNAAVGVDGMVYWMGTHNFYVYDGSIRVLPCDVWPTVFDDINRVQKYKVYAGFNKTQREVWWLYCTEASDECDRYVLYQVDEQTWSFGTLARTAYIGDSKLFSGPFAAGTTGYLYDHEYGVDDDGAAMTATLETGDIDIAEGDSFMHIGKAVPDFKELTGFVNVTFKGREYPQASEQVTNGPFSVSGTTKYISPRMRARQISIYMESDQMGDHWRFSRMRLELRPHGRRG